MSISKSNQLEGPSNYQVRSLCMKRILEINKVWTYCNVAAVRMNIKNMEVDGRELALSAIKESLKDFLVTVVKQFLDTYECWKHLQDRYEP